MGTCGVSTPALRANSLSRFLSQCDIVTITVPAGPETEGNSYQCTLLTPKPLQYFDLQPRKGRLVPTCCMLPRALFPPVATDHCPGTPMHAKAARGSKRGLGSPRAHRVMQHDLSPSGHKAKRQR